jgi:hypothetical protein
MDSGARKPSRRQSVTNDRKLRNFLFGGERQPQENISPR